MLSLELEAPSELIGVLNFLFSDILLIALITHLTSLIAGLHNHLDLTHHTLVNLKVVSLPHIGGGITMRRRKARTCLILIRLIALVAVAVGNLGLEGRSKSPLVPREVELRVPGAVSTTMNNLEFFNYTERRMRCARSDSDRIVFGPVFDNQCFLDNVGEVRERVYIHYARFEFQNVTAEVRNCTRDENPERFITVLRCDDVGLNCPGPFLIDGEIRPMQATACESVVYRGDKTFVCSRAAFNPTVSGPQTGLCREFGARKEDVENWGDVFNVVTSELDRALFGAAYGELVRAEVEVPLDGTVSVTNVTLAWMIPVVIKVVSLMVLLVWWHNLRSQGAKPIANDEQSLMTMLLKRSNPWHEESGSESGWLEVQSPVDSK